MASVELENPAIKYGLAALIGAAAVIIGALIKANTDARQERRKRRFDTLERCARDFEKSAAVFAMLFAKYAAYLSPPRGPDDEIQRIAEAQLLAGIWDEIASLIGKDVTAALATLHEVDSSLHLIGCVEGSQLVERFRHLAADLQSAIIHREDINGRRLPTAAQWQAQGRILAEARVAVFNRLRADFDAF